MHGLSFDGLCSSLFDGGPGGGGPGGPGGGGGDFKQCGPGGPGGVNDRVGVYNGVTDGPGSSDCSEDGSDMDVDEFLYGKCRPTVFTSDG